MTGPQLTVPCFFEVISECFVEAEVQSVVNVIAGFVAKFPPLEYDFDNHKRVHCRDAEPNYPLLVAVGELEQCYAKSSLAPRLPQQVGTRRNVDKYVHAIVPF